LAPHIVYWRAGEGSGDEILDHIRIVFKITTPNFDENLAEQIRERLNTLLDFKQAQLDLGIPSADWYIYYSEKNGGSDDIDDTTKEIIKVVNYDIMFVKKT
jgi:translation elongation factor EF-1beta